MAPARTGPLVEVAKKVRRKVGHNRDGLLLVMGNRESLDYRLALIDSARYSLDIQMFSWMKDLVGRLVLERVLRAADRGVRVRLLLDDYVLGLTCGDKQLAAIRSHPRVEVRIYNPYFIRKGFFFRSVETIFNPSQKNQRMHNKVIIADHSLAMLGGRNIGDRYHGYSQLYNCVDLEVLVSGPVVRRISGGFERFWNSELSYDVSAFARGMKAHELDELRVKSIAIINKKSSQAEKKIPLGKQDWSQLLAAVPGRMQGGQVRYIVDPPEMPCPSHPVVDETFCMASRARKDLILVTPYLIPDEKLIAMLKGVRKRGVRVRVLVPSAGANNNPVVHSQYQKYRSLLLGLGVEIYELKHNQATAPRRYISEDTLSARKISLHVKAVVVDERFCYLGSLNFDSRAMWLNTEVGLIVESPPLVRILRISVEEMMLPQHAWRVTQDPHGHLLWTSGNQTRKKEPVLNFAQSAIERILRPFHLNNRIIPDNQLYRKYR